MDEIGGRQLPDYIEAANPDYEGFLGISQSIDIAIEEGVRSAQGKCKLTNYCKIISIVVIG